MSKYPFMQVAGILLFFTLTPGISGCGDDNATGGGGDTTTPRFAIATRTLVAGADDLSILVGFTNNLDSGQLDLGNAIEIGGVGAMWGSDGSGEFYITRREDLSMTKYRFQDGSPVVVDRLSFTQELSILGGELMVFDGPDRGFLLQVAEGKGFEIDLEAMAIVDRLDLTALLDPTQPTFMNSIDVFRGNELVAATYATDSVQETVSNSSQIVFFDRTTGSMDVRPAPCGGLTYNMMAANGDIYFSSDPWVAGIHAIDPSRAPEPCLVRLPAGSREPDPNPIMMNDLTGDPTGGLVPFGESSILVRVLDTNSFPLSPATTGFQAFGSPNWTTWEIDLNQPTEARLTDRSPLAGAILYFVVEGEVYDNDTAADFSSTTLVRTTGPDAPAAGLTINGIPLSIVRLR